MPKEKEKSGKEANASVKMKVSVKEKNAGLIYFLLFNWTKTQ